MTAVVLASSAKNDNENLAISVNLGSSCDLHNIPALRGLRTLGIIQRIGRWYATTGFLFAPLSLEE
ncbi:MAG: hypothetical protein WBY71_07475 [Nitrososphaeraceae archaeon]